MKNIYLILMFLFISRAIYCINYYVDYNKGNDSNPGTSEEQSWKHCPGDVNAENIPATIKLLPGDIVYFKSNEIYFGNIKLNFSGDSLNHITYKGDGWGEGKAIIDGSVQFGNWTALNDSIYFADIPESFELGDVSSALNTHEYNYKTGEDDFMWTCQTPNPPDWYFNDNHEDFFSVPNHNITLISITDSGVFNQSDTNYWDNSSLLIWTNPNRVVLRKITDFDPEHFTVYFDSLHNEAIYPDARDQSYSIYNSIHALDQPGEFYADFEEGKIYIYPRFAENIDSSVSISVRPFGVDISTASHVTIEGFEIRKHSGSTLLSGIGIGCFSSASIHKSDIIVRNNFIRHNSHPERGYGGIYLSHTDNGIIENNILENNFRHRGIFYSASTNCLVQGNYIYRSGSTSLAFFTMQNSRIIYNSVLESKGGHANGITLYIASKDILVAGNKIIDCAIPLTFQDCGNLYFINNLIDSKEFENGVNEWARTSRGPWTYGDIVFVNNTLLSVPGGSAMNIGNSTDTIYSGNDTIKGNSYYMYNNIIDAGGSATCIQRDFNIYTRLAWNQQERYGWYLAENESLVEDRNALFVDSDITDLRLCENSPAIASGADISSLLPINKFPDFDFYTDLNRYPRPKQGNWSIGAYEYGSQTIVQNRSEAIENEFTIYPNPTMHSINIKLHNSGDNSNMVVQIFDIRGKQHFIQSVDKVIDQSIKINLTNFKRGVYIVILTNENTSYYQKLIVL